jgi:hypothetical protein
LIVRCLQQFAIHFDSSRGKYHIRDAKGGEILDIGFSLPEFKPLQGSLVITGAPYPWDIEKVGEDLYR